MWPRAPFIIKSELSELTYPELIRELFPRLTGGIRWALGLEKGDDTPGNPIR